MNITFFNSAKTGNFFAFSVLVFALVCVFSIQNYAQTKNQTAQKSSTTTSNLPKVTTINEIKLKETIKPNGKPLLINFWATWCDPCREEFPELVKINADYAGKIDFITISLDDVSDIGGEVPKFLSEMKAKMPAYLLTTDDEGAAISSVSKDWQGGLPFTILFNEKGEIVYRREGKINARTLRSELDKALSGKTVNQAQEIKNY